MSAIWPSDREEISESEFLATVAQYAVDCRRVGTMFWFYNAATRRVREGEPIPPQEVVEFVRVRLYKGEPIFRFIRSKRDPSRVAIAYTAAGRQMARDYKGWLRVVHRQPCEYDGFDS